MCNMLISWVTRFEAEKALLSEGQPGERVGGPFPNLPYLIGLRDRLHTVGKGMWGLEQKLEGPWNFTQSYTPVPSSCAAWGVLAPPSLVSDKQHRCFQPAFPPVLWPALGKRAKDEIRLMILARSCSESVRPLRREPNEGVSNNKICDQLCPDQVYPGQEQH